MICLNNNNFFLYLPLTSSHLHPLQVENCDSNSRLVVDEDDNGKFRLERGKSQLLGTKCFFRHQYLRMFGLKLNKYQSFSATGTTSCGSR